MIKYNFTSPSYLPQLFFLFLLLTFFSSSYAQNNSVAIGSEDVKENAVLWLNGKGNQGLLLPNVTSLANIVSPDAGMVVYSSGSVHYFDGSDWTALGSGGSGGSGNTYTLRVDGNNTLVLVENGSTDITTIDLQNVTLGGDLSGDLADAQLAENSVGFAELSDMGATDGQILQYNGTSNSWEVIANTGGVSYTPGTGISITGSEISANETEIVTIVANNGFLTAETQTATDVPYTDNNSLGQTTVQGAIDALASSGVVNTDEQDLSLNTGTNELSLTNDATSVDLTPYLDNTDGQTASDVPYTDNNSLGQTTVQGAIDVLASSGVVNTDEQDASEVPVTAQNGVTSTDTQAALEELQGEITTNTDDITINTDDITINTDDITVNTTDITTNTTDIATNITDITDNTTDLANKVDANAAITGATNTKITYDAKGLVVSGTTLAASDLPTMTSTVGGAVPTPPNNTTTYLRGDGTFAAPAGSGTVTDASVISANGFTGTVATSTTTPAITIGTSVTGVLKGDGTGISPATAGTDYLAPNGDGSGLTNLNASSVASGTLPTARLDVGSGANQVVQLDGTSRLPAVDGSQLTNLPAGTESDPIVEAITGIVKSDGTTISAATAGTDYLTPTGNGSGLTSLNAANVATGTLPTARLDVGTGVNQLVQLDGTGILPAIDGSQLTNLPAETETDPVVEAITGIVKSDGTTISAATAGTDYLAPNGDGSALTNVDADQVVVSASGNLTSTDAQSALVELQTDIDTKSSLDETAQNGILVGDGSNISAVTPTSDVIFKGNGTTLIPSLITDDGTNIGINNPTPTVSVDISTTDGIRIPVGTTAERPGTPGAGMIRYNVETSSFEGYDGAAWNDFSAGEAGGEAVGTIMAFAGGSVPAGYLLCDGSAVSRSTFSDLFTAVGTAWGTGDGSTTFNVPDLRGRFVRGVNDGSGNDPDAAGRTALSAGNIGDNVGSYQDGDLESHRHFSYTSTGTTGGTGSHENNSNSTAATVNSSFTGGNETRPINAYVQFMIKSEPGGTAGGGGGGSGTVTNVSGSGPINVSNGSTTPAISISQANGSSDGYLSSTDFNTFDNKLSGTIGTAANNIVQLDGSSRLPVVDGSQLTNLPAGTESDPIVEAITGIVMSDGATISAATAGTDYLTPTGSAAALTSFPVLNQNTTGSAGTITGAITESQVTNLTTNLASKVDENAAITGATNTKITYDAKGLVVSGTTLAASDLPAMTSTVGGAVPTPPNNTTTFLRGDGTFAAPATGTETDPVVAAISGLVKSDGTTISAATAGTDYLTPTGSAAALTSFPVLNQNTTGSAGTITGAITESQVTNLTTNLANKVDVNTAITGATNTKITYDAKGLVVSGTTLAASDLPAMTSTVGGAVPTPPNNTTTFLRGDGTFAAPASGWGLTGNAITDPANEFIGTTDAVEFNIRTNDTERVTILSAGNVGIGTSTPDAILEVENAAGASTIHVDATANATIDLDVGTDTDESLVNFQRAGVNRGSIRYTHNAVPTSEQLNLNVNNNFRMTILGDGNVGIGNTAPTDKLTVDNATMQNAIVGTTTFANSDGNGNIGVRGVSSGNTGDNFGVLGQSTGGSNSYGVTGAATGGTATSSGIYGVSSNSSSPLSMGVRGESTGNSTSTIRSAGYFSANATGTGTNYGVYATATAGDTNYAGYFQGNVAITGDFKVGGTPSSGTAGQVLTSNGDGNAPGWTNTGAAPTLQNAYDGDGEVVMTPGKDINIRSAAGVDYFHLIQSTNRLGLGLANPSYTLDIRGGGGGSPSEILRLLTQNADSDVDFVAQPTGTGNFNIRSNGGADALVFQTGGLNDRMLIDATGNVGIGTTTPTSDLQIGTRTHLFQDGSNNVIFTNNISEDLTYTTSDHASFMFMTDGGTMKWGNTFGAATTNAGDPVGADINEWMIMQTGGGIEINSSLSLPDDAGLETVIIQSPADITASYDFILPPAGGTAGQVLSTLDASGQLTWATAAASLVNNDDPQRNIFAGTNAGSSLSSGTNNTIYGERAGQVLSTGNFNVMMGSFAGSNSNGTSTVIIGTSAGQNNTGSNSVMIGNAAGQNNTGNFNSFIGTNAGQDNTGSSNTFIGYLSGDVNTSGANNVFVGRMTGNGTNSGTANLTGGNITLLGYRADVGVDGLSNATAIGANAIVSQDNSIVLGNGANVGIGISAPVTPLHINTATASSSMSFTNSSSTNGFIIGSTGVGAVLLNTETGGGIEFGTEGTTKMIISETGNVGIGTSTPNFDLNIENTVAAELLLTRDDDIIINNDVLGKIAFGGTDGGVETGMNQMAAMIAVRASGTWSSTVRGSEMVFHTKANSDGLGANSTERMRINSGGNVGIGTTSPSHLLHVNGTFRATGATSLRASGSGWSDHLNLEGSTGGIWNILVDAGASDKLRIRNSTSGNEPITIQTDGRIGVGTSAPSDLLHVNGTFRTAGVSTFNSDVNISGAVTMINGLYVEDVDNSGFAANIINSSGNGDADGVLIRLGNTTPADNNEYIRFENGAGFSAGRIVGATLGTAVNFITVSDRRLKTDIEDFPNALELLSKIQPRIYEFISVPGLLRHGFIAQELQLIYPEAVSGSPEDDVETSPMGLDYSKLTPLLTAAIQEQQVLIENQETRIAELEKQIELAKTENTSLKASVVSPEQLKAMKAQIMEEVKAMLGAEAKGEKK
jgi:microcystin-dependent protein